MVERPPDGLRARKKRAARDAIAAAARRLFTERGYDAVTVAEIAAAADVSEKTVFNHFATKEDLAFPDRREGLKRLLAGLAERPSGASILDVFRATTAAMIDEFAAADDGLVALARIIDGSRGLEDRLATGWEDETAALALAIAESSGATKDDVVPAVLARTLSWTQRAILRAALAGLMSGEDPDQLTSRLRVAADRAYDQLADGLGEYGSSGRTESARSQKVAL